jgi:tetratricopeptide (TPR) repeat protein
VSARAGLAGLAALALVLGAPAAQAAPRAAQDAPAAGAQESADDKAFLAELAAAFRRGGSFGAERDLQEYLTDFPASAEARRLAASVAFQHGRLDEALAHLDAGGDPDPRLRARILLRQGQAEDALALANGGRLAPLAAACIEVEALDALGRHVDARRRARQVSDGTDDSSLDGAALLDLGRLLLFQRRFELANQALVFADAELNGKQGPSYKLVEPEALLLLGEVYEQTRQSGQGGADPALTVLKQVLEQDAGRVEALVLRARVHLYGMNGQEAADELEAALARDPSNPDALVLRGRTRLIDRRIDDALADADAVLAGNPRQRDALALRAAALAVTTRAEEAAAARKAFETAHPESAALDFLLGEVLENHYRFEESLAPLNAALAQEPDDERPLPVLAQSLANLGREEEARAALLLHQQASPFPYPWRNNMLVVLDKLAGDVELTGEGERRFKLRLPPADREVLGPLLMARLGGARADLAQRWGLDPPGEVLVEVFDQHADFSVRTVGFEGFLALGACFGPVMTMLSPRCELRGQFQWAQTAVHEYAHVVTLALSRQRVPRWLTEGLSVVEEKRFDPAWARELERPVLDARANGQLFPVLQLDEAFRDGETVMLGYYQGSLLCEVIERDFGFPALRALVAAFADGSTTEQALRAALKVDPAELDRRLLAYVDTVVAARAAVRPTWNEAGKELLRQRVQSGDSSALVPLAAAYHDLRRGADEDATLQRAQAELGETPELLRALAERDAAQQRFGPARERLERWAAEGRPDADGLKLLSHLQLKADDEEACKASLRRAIALFPGDVAPDSATRLLLSLLDPDKDKDEIGQVLERLCAYDENALEERVQLAERAAAAGDAAAAERRYAEAVEIDPYRPDLRMPLAELLAARGDVGAARAQWELVLAMREEQMPDAGGAEPEDGETVVKPGASPVKPRTWSLDALQEQARARLEATAGAAK